MSVLIRGLSKPENCFSCPFFDVFSPTRAGGDEDYQCDLFVSLDYWQAAGKADKACPLVEVPKHGDLIDRDAYCKQCYEDTHFLCGDDPGCEFCKFKDAPTVIESEDGDQ